MAIKDYLDDAQRAAKEKQKKKSLISPERREEIKGFITRSFNQVVENREKFDKAMARSIAEGIAFRVDLTARLKPVTPANLIRNFMLSMRTPSASELEVNDIRQNEAYKNFEKLLNDEGFQVADITIEEEYVDGHGSVAKAALRISPA